MRLTTAVLGGMITGAIIGLAIGAKAASGPSVIIQSVRSASASYRGGDIQVQATVRHTKDCPVLLHRWLTRSDATGHSEWWPLVDAFAPPVPIARSVSFTMHIPVPASVPEGKYVLRARAQDQCSRLPFQAPIRDTSLPVDIHNPTDAAPNQVVVPPGSSILMKAK